MADFFAMGGYAGFVWPAYGITFAVIFLNVWLALRSLKIAKIETRRRIAVQSEPR